MREKAAKLDQRLRATAPMASYLLKRLLLIIPTLFGIMLISFAIIQFAPGGPVERMIAQLTGTDSRSSARIGGGGGDMLGGGAAVADRARARPTPSRRSIAARRGWIRNSSRAWRSSSASTSRRTSASS